MKTSLKILTLTLLFFVVSGEAMAQCNEFTKKKCIPMLSPYTFNGQYNNTVLTQGETAELQLTFYKDQEYRILIFGEENLGRLEFQLLDTDYNVLYDNKDEKFSPKWDFMVEDTDDFIVRVTVPSKDTNSELESGCVSILVGFRAFGTRTIFK